MMLYSDKLKNILAYCAANIGLSIELKEVQQINIDSGNSIIEYESFYLRKINVENLSNNIAMPIICPNNESNIQKVIIQIGKEKFKFFNGVDETIIKSNDFKEICKENFVWIMYPKIHISKFKTSYLINLISNFISKSLIKINIFNIIFLISSSYSILYISQIFGNIIPDSDLNNLIVISILFLTGAAISSTIQYIRNLFILNIQSKIELYFFPVIFDKIINKSVGSLKNISSGEINKKIFIANEVINQITSLIVNLPTNLLALLFYLAIMIFYSTAMTFTYFMLCSLILIANILFSLVINKYNKDLVRNSSELWNITNEYIDGISKIKSSYKEDIALQNWQNQFFIKESLSYKISKINNFRNIANNLLFLFTNLCIYLAIHFSSSQYSIGDLIGFTFISGLFSQYFSIILKNITDLLHIKSNVKELQDLFNNDLLNNQSQYKRKINVVGKIEFKNITYKVDNKEILKDISFNISQGEKLAIIGKSGSGKSTILKILLGINQPNKGEILIDDINIEQFNEYYLRDQISSVLQDDKLFQGTVYYNLTLGNIISQENVWCILKQIGLDSDIERMPMKLHTIISDDANNISGGQKQKLLLARALLRKPKILLLDEATSALDNISQNMIKKYIDNLKITTIIVAHRISTIKNADKILVIDRGELVECDNYINLLKSENPTTLELLSKHKQAFYIKDFILQEV